MSAREFCRGHYMLRSLRSRFIRHKGSSFVRSLSLAHKFALRSAKGARYRDFKKKQSSTIALDALKKIKRCKYRSKKIKSSANFFLGEKNEEGNFL